MAEEKKESQSYGSQGDWLRGEGGGKANEQKRSSPPEDGAELDESVRGGLVSPVQRKENE
ncbi:MAG: hypothetical protein JWO97_3099 [Acidobacteria bacterium]|nr:hypothetical protein [Acidobacteriota bacterium]